MTVLVPFVFDSVVVGFVAAAAVVVFDPKVAPQFQIQPQLSYKTSHRSLTHEQESAVEPSNALKYEGEQHQASTSGSEVHLDVENM